MPRSENIVWNRGRVTREQREALLRQKGCVVWFTGLSGSGKSTLAWALEERLTGQGHLVYVLDGDNVRHGLNQDLGFGQEDRHENLRRVGEVAALFADAGLIVPVAFISPYRADRAAARAAAGEGRFIEVFVDAPLKDCEERDPKGLYRRARAGEIPEFTGITAPYEHPEAPESTVETARLGLDACLDILQGCLREAGIISAP